MNAVTGSLGGGGFVGAGGGPESMAISPNQKYLTVANRNTNNLSQFTINQSNGNLTPNGNVGTSTSPAVILTSGSNP
ncbi:beta-propeller fold lactonase family protein [Leptospira terpstrae]|uniref:beta-propeller fold lactonase family protein n=1 Tax=Leptospira terpstrae TaxID=293075 RepID=UPI003D08ED91